MIEPSSANLLAVLYNSTVLLSLALAYDLLVIPLFGRSTVLQRLLIGVGVGLFCLGVMMTPWRFAPGVIFDTRSVLLSISGLFFGVIPTLVAAVMASLFRIYQGGAGAMTGVLVIVGTSLVGIGWRFWRRPALADMSWRELYLFGVAVHLVMVLLLLTLPQPIANAVVSDVWAIVLIVYPIVTALLGRLMVNRIRRSNLVAAVQQSEARYRSYVDNAPYAVFVTDEQGRYREVNKAACQLTGYSEEELLAAHVTSLLPPEAHEDGAHHFQTVEREGYAYGEFPFVRKDGSCGRWSVAAVKIAPTRFLGYCADITAQREAEEARQRSEQTALAVLNATDDSAFLIDTSYRVQVCNVELTRRLQRNEEEILGRSIFDLLPTDVVAHRRHHIEMAIRTCQPVRFEDEYNGLIASVTVYPILDAHSAVTQLAVFEHDITRTRLMEERYSTLFREMLNGFALHEIICDENGQPVDYRFLDVNPSFERLTGLCADQIIGKSVLTVLPMTEAYWIEVYGQVVLTRQPVHFENYTQSVDRYFEVTAFSPAPRQFATIFSDITERKRAELAIQRRDALLEVLSFAAGSLLEAESLESVLPEILQRLGEVAGINHIYLFQNEEGEDGDLLSSLRYEWCASGVASQLDNPILQRASYRDLGFTRWVDIMAGGGTISGYVREFPAAEQHLLISLDILSGVIAPIFVERRWWGFIGFTRNDAAFGWLEAEIEALHTITRALGVTIENLASRSRIQQQTDELSQIMNGVPEGLLLLDNAGGVISANPHARQYLEWLTGDKACKQVSALGDRSLASLLTSPTERWGHIVHAGQRTFEVLAQLVEREPASASWVLVIREVTSELFVQEQLQRQERLAAVGQLAAGIAHDFNNLMSVVILYAQLASQSESLNEQDRNRMRVVEEQGQRAAKMIRQILDFSRRTTIARHPIDLLPLLKEQIKLLQRTLPESITITLETPLTECFILGDPTRLEQVIMNLAFNARDAMPEGGRLCIGVDTMEFAREKEVPLPGMKPGRWVRLTVNDTGVGIAPTDIEHVFEPFFTTKPIGVGTGLGLPQVHGIVGQHNGHVTIESAVGSGTICTIYLPVLAMLTPGVVETISSLTHANGHGETILVVEDEEALRRTLKEVLEQWNYHVVDVGNGQEALNALDDGLRPDLILSDVVMPEMSGLALFKAMRKRELDIPLIFLTGHLRGEELDNLRQVGLRAWLPKPPSIAQLAETITSILH